MGTGPDDPMYGYGGQGYPPPPGLLQSNKGRGMALAGLILGIVALFLFWIPIISWVALVMALVGLGLGIAALVTAVRERTSARGLSIAAVVVSGVALLASILVTAFWGALFSAVDDEASNNSSSTITRGATDSPPVSGSATSSSSASATASAQLLPLGTAGEVGDYAVTVSSVQLGATDAILGFNEFNQAPEGQYVLITLDVVYNGTEEGDPWLDLRTNFVGSDNRQYDESTCLAVLDLQGTSVPTLENGGEAQYEVCMDVPAAALPGQRVLVEDTFGLTEPTEASWQTE
ncbi:DUF4190 and DUF4352 domain-containing protein [Arthrobacter gandavensis]|uniref:DUF4190 domain-containing protein n=1 Tax=Arthrobacter gandavensis TaxID=169960 RepID=UPI00188F5AA0|nr:DUF4190 domain-containing protein [Arthrobacter gandavensis]MBF4993241.1 DUF4190 and DUF4352 domain-containing protein [Arthrobacter gandavensis]